MKPKRKMAVLSCLFGLTMVSSFVAYTHITTERLANSREALERYPLPSTAAEARDDGPAQQTPGQRTADTPRRTPEEAVAACRRLYERLPEINNLLADGAEPPQDFVIEIREAIRLIFNSETLDRCGSDFDCLESLDGCGPILYRHMLTANETNNADEALRDALSLLDLFENLALVPYRQYEARGAYIEFSRTLLSLPLAPDTIATILDRLNRVNLHTMLRIELTAQLHSVSEHIERWKKESYSDFVEKSGIYWGTRSWLWARPICRPWFNEDMRQRLDLLTQILDVCDRPYYEAQPVLDQITCESYNLANGASTYFIQSAIEECQGQAEFEAVMDMMRIGLLLKQYHSTNGSFPETLDVFAPQFSGKLPIDPLTGVSYEYSSKAPSFSKEVNEAEQQVFIASAKQNGPHMFLKYDEEAKTVILAGSFDLDDLTIPLEED